MSAFGNYRYDLGQQRDAPWDQYLNVLLPSPESLQQIANMDLLDVFAKQGDVHSVPGGGAALALLPDRRHPFLISTSCF
jgi:hypothetical protein